MRAEKKIHSFKSFHKENSIIGKKKSRRCYIESTPMVVNKLDSHRTEIFIICFSLCSFGSFLSFYLLGNMKNGKHLLLCNCYKRKMKKGRRSYRESTSVKLFVDHSMLKWVSVFLFLFGKFTSIVCSKREQNCYTRLRGHP